MRLAVTFVLLFVGVTLAQQPTLAADQQPPPPAPELKANLEAYIGTWTCTGKQEAGEMGPAASYKFKKEISWDLGGYWVVTKSEDLKTKGGEMHMTYRSFMGFDPVAKKLTSSNFFPGGGTLSATSSGWEGNRMTWTVEINMMGEKMSARHFFEKKSDTETYDWVEMAAPDGKMKKVMEAACSRTVR
jgi:hypothetical protein